MRDRDTATALGLELRLGLPVVVDAARNDNMWSKVRIWRQRAAHYPGSRPVPLLRLFPQLATVRRGAENRVKSQHHASPAGGAGAFPTKTALSEIPGIHAAPIGTPFLLLT
jgi:hypothetical protein